MSLADVVLAKHRLEKADVPPFDEWCQLCDGDWPCESVRLALSLHAAEQVVEAARAGAKCNICRGRGTWTCQCDGQTCSRGCLSGKTCDTCRGTGLQAWLIDLLAEYDKGGQG